MHRISCLQKGLLGFLCLFLCTLSAEAGRLERYEVPEPLKPWVDWVLEDQKDLTCPFLYNNATQKRCAWPTRLNLSLNELNGDFSIVWQIYKESWITLPGDQKHWPLAVTDNDQPLTITRRKGRPMALLQPGTHHITGKFAWQRLPDSLSIPKDTGLVALTINQKLINSPNINKGQIWIKQRQSNNIKNKEQISLQVYRNIVDEIPMQVTTKIDLQVSGKQREAIIGKPLLKGDTPLSISSQLPARLEPDGQLRVQLRPGRWSINLVSRLPGKVAELQLPKQTRPWPATEIWSFSARNHLRLVEISGVTSIDPRQTKMPDRWRQFPAYRLNAGEAMTFKTIRRGDPEPEPDSLSLQRNFWLDQNGKGFTISDNITGRMTQGWRLEATDQLLLGRVTLDGNPQFITRHDQDGQTDSKMGVEVRRGTINLQADSRYEGDVTDFNAAGWDHDFQSVNATLHLPPGWELFSARGVDTVPNTWLQRWTLLDLFLVLIASVAVSRLWNWRVGVLSLITLALLWHEPGAPRQIWLHIIAAIALLRVLPPGKLRWLVSSYRNLAMLGLLLLSIPFMIDQVRLGLFPQLERPWQQAAGGQSYTDNQFEVSPMVADSVSEMPQEITKEMSIRQAQDQRKRTIVSKAASPLSSAPAGNSIYNRSKFSSQYDTKTNVQTGPGLPHWQWKQIPLRWNGPVEKEQSVDLTLLSPKVNLFLNLLRLLLLIALALLITGIGRSGFNSNNIGFPEKTTTAKAAMLLALLAIPLAGLFYPQTSQADIPGPEILQELKKRLLAPPDCLPECAQMERMKLEITPDELVIRSLIHTVENVMVPLPGQSGQFGQNNQAGKQSSQGEGKGKSHLNNSNQWSPTLIMVDGNPAEALHRDNNGTLWIHLEKGRHQLILFGRLPNQNSVDLALPLKPSRINLEIEGWDITGLDEDSHPDNQLQLTRLKESNNQANEKLETDKLPPFVKLHRTLRLGIDWRVETRIERVSPVGTAVVIKVPLLKGESVLSNSLRVQNDHVLVNMSPRQSSLHWESSLKPDREIILNAPETTEWIEIWYADVSPVWHLESSGISVVHHQNPEGQWLPEWHPWPGESVTLSLSRPEGIPGQTLTIDNSQLNITPGERATDVNLSLSLRSSQGGQHTLTLPEQMRLQSVTIDGKSQPIRQSGTENRQVTLPIHPGKQDIKLAWREPEGDKNLLKTPQIDLGTDSVNHTISLNLSRDRWVLFTGGPQWGPAVLFWGLLIIIIIASLGLGRIKLTPLKTWQWILLGIGLSQAPIFAAVLVVAWLLALGAREKLIDKDNITLSKTRFNLIQIGLGVLTLVALSCLFEAIRQGLLGSPDMQIAGNNSSAYNLHWYEGRMANTPPQAWVLSVPLLAYRVLMLAWSLWLAFALLHWLRWGWECFSRDGIWQAFQLRKKPKNYEPPHADERNNPVEKE